jgi:hypothetical protein
LKDGIPLAGGSSLLKAGHGPHRAHAKELLPDLDMNFFFHFFFFPLIFFCWLRITSSRQSLLLPLLSKHQNGQESEAELLVIRRPGCGWMKKPPN